MNVFFQLPHCRHQASQQDEGEALQDQQYAKYADHFSSSEIVNTTSSLNGLTRIRISSMSSYSPRRVV